MNMIEEEKMKELIDFHFELVERARNRFQIDDEAEEDEVWSKKKKKDNEWIEKMRSAGEKRHHHRLMVDGMKTYIDKLKSSKTKNDMSDVISREGDIFYEMEKSARFNTIERLLDWLVNTKMEGLGMDATPEERRFANDLEKVLLMIRDELSSEEYDEMMSHPTW